VPSASDSHLAPRPAKGKGSNRLLDRRVGSGIREAATTSSRDTEAVRLHAAGWFRDAVSSPHEAISDDARRQPGDMDLL